MASCNFRYRRSSHHHHHNFISQTLPNPSHPVFQPRSSPTLFPYYHTPTPPYHHNFIHKTPLFPPNSHPFLPTAPTLPSIPKSHSTISQSQRLKNHSQEPKRHGEEMGIHAEEAVVASRHCWSIGVLGSMGLARCMGEFDVWMGGWMDGVVRERWCG